MAEGEIEVRLRTDGEAEFRALAQRLRQAAAGELERKLRRNLRAAGRPVVSDLRAAVMRVNVTSSRGGMAHPSYSRNLRQRIASAIRVSVAFAGIRFAVQGSAVGDGKYGFTLPKYMDGELPMYKNWRHPVFGNENVWEVQYGQPWFFVTIREHAADFEEACVAAINEIVMEIGR